MIVYVTTSDDPREDDVTINRTIEAKGSGAYAEFNGMNLYYESHGTGRPMILLHGGLGAGEMFEPILPTLSEHHRVIVVDLQGHGRTADIDRPIDVRAHGRRHRDAHRPPGIGEA